MIADTDTDTTHERMHCMEVWGGNSPVDRGFATPGLQLWLHSQPYDRAEGGGDVYYVSSCASGRITRLLLADISGHGERARIKATRASIANICTAIDVYEVDTGRFPPTLQNLLQSSGEPNWNGPYLRGGLPADAWGTPFGYSLRGENGYEVRSAGPDLQMSTGDDITSF